MEGYEEFLNVHRPQLISSNVPDHFWPQLYRKLKEQDFDAGSTFSLLLIDYGDEPKCEENPVWTIALSKENGIRYNDSTQIYLIDHAWTFRTDKMRSQLETYPTLVNRLAVMMGIDQENQSETYCINTIIDKIWKYCNMYSVSVDGLSVENQMPIWYVMDELGSAVLHSDSPNCRIIPFMHVPEQATYSLLFPLKDIQEGEQVFRDFVEGTPENSRIRDCLLLPWKYTTLCQHSFKHLKPNKDYFLSGHVEETLPDPDSNVQPKIDANRPLKVFSEYSLINEYLTDPSFEIVDNQEEADIFWLIKHFKGYKEFNELYPNKFINQFPFENVITVKDLLSIVCRRAKNENVDDNDLSCNPKWLPTTYNLKTELVEFVSYFQNRARQGLDNHWIVKPWNLARSLDMYITRNIGQIMKLQQTGPKIAQKYIENPVLFERMEVSGGKVKFDLRYVILLKSVDELEAYIYTNFFLRFANKPFELDQFDDYEKHFTVMNYGEFTLKHMKCDEFLENWKTQYPQFDWQLIEDDICKMLKEILQGAVKKLPPCGIGSNLQSRALYACDIILEFEGNSRIQPKILEINWTPDCKRACEYYPDFYNDIFNLLFLGQENVDVFRKIV